jgi:hypothetical protein
MYLLHLWHVNNLDARGKALLATSAKSLAFFKKEFFSSILQTNKQTTILHSLQHSVLPAGCFPCDVVKEVPVNIFWV